MDHSQQSIPRMKVSLQPTHHRKSAKTGQVSRCEIGQEIPISVLEQRERGWERDWGARHGCVSQEWSRVGRSGLGEPEVERGSQKRSRGVRNELGESEAEQRSQK